MQLRQLSHQYSSYRCLPSTSAVSGSQNSTIGIDRPAAARRRRLVAQAFGLSRTMLFRRRYAAHDPTMLRASIRVRLRWPRNYRHMDEAGFFTSLTLSTFVGQTD